MSLKVNFKYIRITNQKGVSLKLENICFSLNPPGIYTILGKNGQGKSTLIKTLTGLPKDGVSYLGASHFKGVDLLNCDNDSLKSIRKDSIKYVFQDPVNNFNQLKKIEYYFRPFFNLPEKKNELAELLSYFKLPASDDLFSKYSYELSVGMLQRLSLIISLLSHPEILILDEPTSAIDYGTLNLMLKKLIDFREQDGGIILLVTQDINFAQNISDYIAFLSDGHLTDFYAKNDFLSLKEPISLVNFLNASREIAE